MISPLSSLMKHIGQDDRGNRLCSIGSTDRLRKSVNHEIQDLPDFPKLSLEIRSPLILG